ncbi:MAG: DUF922 domain-containing protein [Proteobacteria bacterium]|nr:DUF922 domain-containing protein [Pseudomonadota bacterium]
MRREGQPGLGAPLLWLAAGGALLLSAPATADLSQQCSYESYEVPALKGRSLRQLLNAATPIREGGNPFHGHTAWHVDWHFQMMPLPSGRCGIDSVQTQLTATITLPGPTDPAIAHSPQFVQYLAALKAHERGHYEIGRHAAILIDQGILTLPSEEDCPRMEQAANDFANAQLAAARDADLRYDRDTGNGRTQGAQLD